MCEATVETSDKIELCFVPTSKYLNVVSSHFDRNFHDQKYVKFRGNGKII